MHQSEACAGPVHLTGQAQPLNLPPRLQQPNVDLVSPTCACVLPAETMMRFLRAGGQIEWLSIMTVMHGLRAARQSMLSARARLPRLILGAPKSSGKVFSLFSLGFKRKSEATGAELDAAEQARADPP